MLDERDIPYLWLNYATEQNYKLFRLIQDEYYYLEEALEDVRKGIFSRFPNLKDETKSRLAQACSQSFIDRYVSWLDRKSIGVVTYDSYNYPTLLKQIQNPPTVLFYRGKLEADMDLPIAIVGTRNCTDYGKDVAHSFGKELSKAGATIITGLATGIDSYAAWGALECTESDLPVVGVLGCGIDIVYPKGNEKLFDSVENRGCIITEFLPKTIPSAYNFPFRNRVISGISQGTIVVEAGDKSGASITAGCALEQGREVFAVPGRISDPMSAGTNRMIARGEAKAITSVNDILEEFGLLHDDEIEKTILFDSLSPSEQAILSALRQGEKSEDELLSSFNGSIGELIAVLTSMTFSGLIKQLPGSMYAIDTFSVNIVY